MFVRTQITHRRVEPNAERRVWFPATLVFLLFFGVTTDIAAQVTSMAGAPATRAADSGVASEGELQTAFEVRFLEFDNVYLSLQPGSLLTRGMTLLVRRSKSSNAEVIAELKVNSVSSTSAICEVLVMHESLQRGDFAYL